MASLALLFLLSSASSANDLPWMVDTTALPSNDAIMSNQSINPTMQDPWYVSEDTGPFVLEFDMKGEAIGKLIFTVDGLQFTGKADKAAQVFFDYMKANFGRFRLCKEATAIPEKGLIQKPCPCDGILKCTCNYETGSYSYSDGCNTTSCSALGACSSTLLSCPRDWRDQ